LTVELWYKDCENDEEDEVGSEEPGTKTGDGVKEERTGLIQESFMSEVHSYIRMVIKFAISLSSLSCYKNMKTKVLGGVSPAEFLQVENNLKLLEKFVGSADRKPFGKIYQSGKRKRSGEESSKGKL